MADTKTVLIDANLHKRLKKVAFASDTPLRFLLHNAIVSYLPEVEKSVEEEEAAQQAYDEWKEQKEKERRKWIAEVFKVTHAYPTKGDVDEWEKEYRVTNPRPGKEQGKLFDEDSE